MKKSTCHAGLMIEFRSSEPIVKAGNGSICLQPQYAFSGMGGRDMRNIQSERVPSERLLKPDRTAYLDHMQQMQKISCLKIKLEREKESMPKVTL